MKLMVIDGNSIANRSFYGVRPLTTREGVPTNAVYGFIATMRRLVEEEAPDALCVTFDRREPTFRHQAYSGYKAQRKGMPEDLVRQMPMIREVLDAMDVPCYDLVGYEADDLIGTIARICERAGWTCIIVTGDRDSLQLVTEQTTVKLVTTSRGRTETTDVTPTTFRAAYGFDPIHLIDLKALMGDTSDNIPGVLGIGQKTATDLIQKYQTIDALYAAMPDVDAKPSIRKKLAEGEESARMSYHLATIVTDAPLPFTPETNRIRPPKPALRAIYLRLEFTKFLEKFDAPVEEGSDKPAEDVEAPAYRKEVVTSRSRAEELLERWKEEPFVSVLPLSEGEGLCVAWGTEEPLCVAVLLADQLEEFQRIEAVFFSGSIRKVTNEVKDRIHTLLARGLPADGFIFDVSLAGYLLDATAGHYDLEHLSVSWFNRELPKASLYQAPGVFTDLSPTREEALSAWAAHTALLPRLYAAQRARLREMDMDTLYFDIELPLCRLLAEMEIHGFLVDRAALEAFGTELTARIAALEEKIGSYAGKFNINSPKQLGEVLFDRLHLPAYKKTKTGYSTDAEVLERLRPAHPIVEEVLSYRQYAKLKSTYVDGLLKALSPDSRIHTHFQMTATATGRLSSAEPNLQNIPTRTDLGSEMRRMFVAAPGKVLVDADYSQIELRVLAHISGDRAMQEAFLSGEDFHTVTASHVFHVPTTQVTPSMRRAAKAVNFGIVYGISPFSLAQDIGVSIAEAKAYMAAYFARFQGVKQYMEDVVARARADGYVATLYHRRRALPEIRASNHVTRAFGERVALNMPIQGTAADIIKRAMVKVAARLRAEGLKAEIIMQVHDELLVECPLSEAESVGSVLTEEMEHACTLSIPLVAETHVGANWLEAKTEV